MGWGVSRWRNEEGTKTRRATCEDRIGVTSVRGLVFSLSNVDMNFVTGFGPVCLATSDNADVCLQLPTFLGRSSLRYLRLSFRSPFIFLHVLSGCLSHTTYISLDLHSFRVLFRFSCCPTPVFLVQLDPVAASSHALQIQAASHFAESHYHRPSSHTILRLYKAALRSFHIARRAGDYDNNMAVFLECHDI